MTPARLVLALAAVLFLSNLWGYDVWTPDEPFFAEGAREMIVDGHWLVSHVNGVLNTHKPPLFFWLIALLSLPFGRVTSLAARLPSALASLGTVAMTLRIGRRTSSEATAVLAAFALVTSYMFWEKARSAQIDALLCFLIWIALSAFQTWRAGDADGRRAGVLFWAAAALAVLAKGPVGVLLPLGIAVVTLIVDRDLRRWRQFAPFAGPLAFIAICGAYVVATMTWGPPEYSVWGALKEHFVDRGIHGMHHEQPWWYYAKVLPPQLLPWTFLLPGALVLAWRRRDPTDRFLLVTVIYVVVFFSISTEKRTLYVLPTFPAFALLTARFIGAQLGWEEGPAMSRRWVSVGQSVLAGLLVLVGVAVLAVGVMMLAGADLPIPEREAQEIGPWTAIVLGGIVLATGVVTGWCLARRGLLAATVAPAGGLALALLFVAWVVYPLADRFKSGREFAGIVTAATAESRAAGHRVMAFDLRNLPVQYAFFSDGALYTIETWDVEDLRRHLEQDARVFALANGRRLDELPEALRERLEIVAATKASQRHVVLIASRPAGEAAP